MSGRSAYVRKQNLEQADKRAYKEYSEYGVEDPYIYGYPGVLPRPGISTNPSYMSPTSPRPRRRSASSASSTYGYPLPHMPPHMRKPRPIIVASAIEKSDFRTHLDGMSSSLRGKIGGLIKGRKDSGDKSRTRPDITSASSDYGSRSTDFTPSIGAVPSLSASTTPSEGQETYSTGHHSHSTSAPRQRQQQESVIHKIRRFEGGGKLPQLGWKSLSNVRVFVIFLLPPLLMKSRILNYGMRMETHSSICICVVRGRNHRPRSASTPELSNNLDPGHSLTCCVMSTSPRVGPNSTPVTSVQ